MNDSPNTPFLPRPIVITMEQRRDLYDLHRNIKGVYLQFDKLCRDLDIVTSTKK